MTVGELIAALSDLPFEREVWLEDTERMVTHVEVIPGLHNDVWLHTGGPVTRVEEA